MINLIIQILVIALCWGLIIGVTTLVSEYRKRKKEKLRKLEIEKFDLRVGDILHLNVPSPMLFYKIVEIKDNNATAIYNIKEYILDSKFEQCEWHGRTTSPISAWYDYYVRVQRTKLKKKIVG